MYRNLYLNANLIKRTTEKAILFEILNDEYNGNFSFWCPKALTKRGFTNGVQYVALDIPDEFIFTITYFQIDRTAGNEIVNTIIKETAKDFIAIMQGYDQEVRRLAKIELWSIDLNIIWNIKLKFEELI